MAKIFVFGPMVDREAVLSALAEVNLQAASFTTDGSMIVVGETEEAEVETLLTTAFESRVSVLEAELHVPQDWSRPGFVYEVATANPDARIIMTSGRGVLTVT